MCECVVESAIFTLKLKKSEISLKKLKRDFSVKSAWKTRDFTVKDRESAWKTCDFGVINKLFQNMFLQSWIYSVARFIANTITVPGTMNVQESLRKARERALRAKAEVNGSDESGAQGHL